VEASLWRVQQTAAAKCGAHDRHICARHGAGKDLLGLVGATAIRSTTLPRLEAPGSVEEAR
jgi:hypothetical protein